MEQKRKNQLLGTILFSGFLLRLISVVMHSYSSDELSAITRLKYDTFSELIEFGVKTGDMHPAGVQFFMKIWSYLFGVSEIAMRFPFIILGTISIYLIYKIGNRYSIQVGLFSAGLWAVLLFPTIQSELARPYSPGVLFVLLSAIFILRFTFDSLTKKQLWTNTMMLGLTVAACMYMHYFAFLMAGFMAITGLLFIKKQVVIPYLIAGFISILLFIPHLGITIYQTSIDGGIQWLSPPGKYWLFQFLFHSFNSSWLLIILFFLPCIFALKEIISKKRFSLSNKSILFLTWFFGIYGLGVFLSYNFTPVLKFPVMVFALPFLIIVFSQFISPTFNYLKGAVPTLLLTATILSTTIEKSLFQNIHYEVFKELAVPIRTWDSQIGLENITAVMNISNPEYLNFYAEQSGESIDLDLSVLDYGDGLLLDSILQNSPNEYLILGFSGRHTPVQFFNQGLRYFPNIVDGYQYNNSSVYLLSKSDHNAEKQLKIEQNISFASDKVGWSFDDKKLNTSTNSYTADSLNTYRPQYILQVNKLLASNKQFVRIVLSALVNENSEITLVAVPETYSGEPIKDNYGKAIWLGLDVEKVLQLNKTASFAFSLPPSMPRNGTVKIYIWNRNGNSFTIKNVEIQTINNVWNN